MTVTLPESLKFGYVTGRYIVSVGDGSDADRTPDARPAEGLVVTFTPSVTMQRTADPVPTTVLRTAQSAHVGQDGLLYEPDQPQPGVWLVTGVYTVTFGGSVPAAALPAGFTIEVTEQHTPETPLYLTSAAPYVPPAGVTAQVVQVLGTPVPGSFLGVTDAGQVAYVPGSAGPGPDPAQVAAMQAVLDDYQAGVDATDLAVSATLADPDSATRAGLSAHYAQRTILPATRMRSWGHSFMAGVGTGGDPEVLGMARLIADKLLLPLSNKAIGGAALYYRLSPAHWGIVLRDEVRPTSFVPRGGFHPVMYGLNDLNRLGNTYAQLQTFRSALRTVVARLRSAAIFEEDHASVVLGGAGAWFDTAPGSGDFTAYSGKGSKYNTTPGGTITINTPADFPGGTMVLGFTAWTDGGATVSGTVNGQTYSVNTAATFRSDSYTPAVLRIPDVPAGAGTYTFTTSNIVGTVGAVFDYWSWEPPEHAAPLVVLVGQPKPLDYTGYGAPPPPGPPTDAGVDALNQHQQELAAEFGHRVLYVDTSEIDKDPAYWVPGNVHPNATGHAWIAEKVASEVQRRVSFAAVDLSNAGASVASGGSEPPPPTPAPAWQDYTPTLTGSGTSQGDGVFQVARYLRVGDIVYYCVRFLWKPATVLGATVEVSLPVPMLTVGDAISLQATAQKQVGTGAGNYIIGARHHATTTARLYVPGVNGQLALVNATTPFTWELNDSFDLRGIYRAA